MKTIIDNIEKQYKAFCMDTDKALSGNKTAARRTRMAALNLIGQLREYRRASIAAEKAGE